MHKDVYKRKKINSSLKVVKKCGVVQRARKDPGQT